MIIINGQFRDLTQEEIDNLPLELKVCFYIKPWNSSFNPQSITEWSNGLYSREYEVVELLTFIKKILKENYNEI